MPQFFVAAPKAVGITSTGETLRANHLKILPDALIHPSQATLFASLKGDQAEIDRFMARLNA